MFVTFEGPEGAGKSTLVRAIATRLEKLGCDVVCTREPGEGDLGKKVRDLLLHGGDLCPQTELFLFLSDRSNHVDRFIRPALAIGKTVLCDRYADSTWVYQSYARGLDPEFVHAANEFATGGLTPNLTILLDLPPEIGLARLKTQDRLDAEPLSFHQKVREGFLYLASVNRERFKLVDASQDAAAVEELAFNLIWNPFEGYSLR